MVIFPILYSLFSYRNPRKEAPENSLQVKSENFLKLGLEPITLDDGLFTEVMEIAKRYVSRVDMSKIPS